MKLIFVFILLFMTPFTIFEIEGKTRILWLTDDSRDQKNYSENNLVSIGTDTTNLLLYALNNYQIDFQLAPISRIDLLLKSQGAICVGNRVRTKDRAQDNIFSLPLNVYPGLRLYYADKNAEVPQRALNQSFEVISLAELFKQRPDKVLGISKGRSFGHYLDDQIKGIAKENIMLRAGNGRYQALIQMLLKNRIDYIIDFPTEVQRKLTEFSQSIDVKVDLKSVAIANSPKFISGRVACTDSVVGRKFIKEVDDVLIQLYQKSIYYQAHARYINKNDLPAFKLSFDKYFQPFIP